MRLKILLKLLACLACVIIAIFILVIISLSYYLHGNIYNYQYAPKSLYNAGQPAWLDIPSINVDAPVESLGITSTGEMAVPKGPTDVAWYDLGPRPGNIGSSVIAGHYGTWINGQGSVFDNLNKLKPGDELYTKDSKGLITTFVVREIKNYNPKADAPEVFNLNDGKAHLNLITCEGVWDQVKQTYSNRLVVFTDKE